MYITGNTAALESAVSAKAYKVFLILCQYANNQTRECFVSRNTLARQCALSLSSVIRALRELVTEGLIAIVSRFRENGRQPPNPAAPMPESGKEQQWNQENGRLGPPSSAARAPT